MCCRLGEVPAHLFLEVADKFWRPAVAEARLDDKTMAAISNIYFLNLLERHQLPCRRSHVSTTPWVQKVKPLKWWYFCVLMFHFFSPKTGGKEPSNNLWWEPGIKASDRNQPAPKRLCYQTQPCYQPVSLFTVNLIYIPCSINFDEKQPILPIKSDFLDKF